VGAGLITVGVWCYNFSTGVTREGGHIVLRLSVREMRAALPSLEELVRREGELVVTRRGRPIARVLPMRGGAGDMPSHAELRASLPRQEIPSEVLLAEDREAR
jgi:antitoxin (DNA-binding transcriptional repressor) of toxin-antitoxin stability system